MGDDDSAEDLGPVFDAIRQLTLTTEVFFLHGNRDFLVGDVTARKLGIHILKDPQIIHLGSHRVALMHGDQLCTDDNEYQEFRAQVRSAQWKQNFLAKPLSERQSIAAQLRAQSQLAMQQKSDSIMDVNQQTTSEYFDQLGVDTIIHGHTHRPCIHKDNPAKLRIVLGDWNPEPSYLSWQDGRFDLFDPRVSGSCIGIDQL